ncbi:carbon-nitrogen hydrolase family protein [Pseudarthrobacter sp. NamE5]|uniref:carbon-nitrogen hydrolase family protein n=1 Tax=Pseudarthrobacter sp. NamE5 TaxID=2576839 RepID=UPI00110C1594|nr:carbon-nitrogen hydrolase family protein [Pseudarthrobacter sp. NamE5]TLM80905.1 carbon-nitrogen hydrolase family protein [Pseudarthrobacter sp. NamE5]
MRIAVAQISSCGDPLKNLELVERFGQDAAKGGAELVVFPEATMCAFGNDLYPIAEPLNGPWANRVREMAIGLGIVMVVGMFTPGSGHRVKNTLLAVGPEVDNSYDKVHLFDAYGYKESDSVEPGTRPVTFALNGHTVGLATCYDIRFPALFTASAGMGATINIVCASWGAGENKIEQWSLLTQARALDSTSFVIACGQADPTTLGIPRVGNAPTGVGHSAVVSPLGQVILQLSAEPSLAFVDIDPNEVEDVRLKLPVLANAHSFLPPPTQSDRATDGASKNGRGLL